MTRVVAVTLLLALGATACSRNREADTQKLIDDLRTLDEAVMEIVKVEPNAAGLAKAEALVDAKQAQLHDVMVKVTEDGPNPSAMPLAYASVANAQSARVAYEYMQNAVLETNPQLLVRAKKFGLKMCGICVLKPSDAYQCSFFEPAKPGT